MGKAVLFYSQYPNGTLDRTSIHGGCPVLDGTKWLANLWVWNGPRNTYPGEPKKNKKKNYKQQQRQRQRQRQQKPLHPKSKKVQFKNINNNPKYKNAELYYKDQFWSTFGYNTIQNVNTFIGHEWNVRVNGNIVLEWIIVDNKKERKENSYDSSSLHEIYII